MSKLLLEGRRREAGSLLKDCMEWFGPDSVYVEVQRNYLQGDAELTRASVGLARDSGSAHRRIQRRPLPRSRAVPSPARPGRGPAQHHHGSGPSPHPPNHHLHLKSPDRMVKLFEDYPQTITQYPEDR